MATLGYYIALPFLYGIALLPLPLLYLLSDAVFVLLFHAVRYRRGVVRTNLRNSFPEKSEAERRTIERDFYRWFCDLVLETVRTLTLTEAQVKRLVAVEGEDVLRRYHDAGRSIILVMGHWGNWELGGARFSRLPYHQLYVIYHPLQNKRFDALMIRMRTRSGTRLYPMQDALKGMLRDRGQLTATAFIADQTPPPEHAYWTTFLHQPTPIFRGTAKIARKLDHPIVYVGVDRPRRGRYVMRFEELVPVPSSLPEDAISELHTRRLEADIRKRPATWLWTHRRWKHKPPMEISPGQGAAGA